MKKVLLCVLTAFALTGCLEDGDIASVKGGVMEFDKSLTVGDALDNWGECTEKNWTEIKSANGRRIVQFECKSTRVQDFMQYVKTHFSAQIAGQVDGSYIDLKETIITFQWTINTDDSFELASASQYLKWADGAVYDAQAPAEKLLKFAYSNAVTFDVSKLQGADGLNTALPTVVGVSVIRRFRKPITPATVQ